MNVAIIGGTGFVGSHIVDALHEAGHSTSLLVRPGSEDKFVGVERSRLTIGDLHTAEAVDAVLKGCDAVIYLVGILRAFPRRGITFENAHYGGVVRIADAAVKLGIRRFLLMSSNGVEAEATPYQQTKRDAERYVEKKGLEFTVLRPSVIFGDPRGRMEFATQLYRDMVRPPVPALGFYAGWRPATGRIEMSPVHVRDVANAFVAVLENPATVGETYELGGPETLSWSEMLQRITAVVGKRKLIIPMPIALMRAAATLFDWAPFFPVTRDQLTMLEQGNVCGDSALRVLTQRTARSFRAENLDYIRVLDSGGA